MQFPLIQRWMEIRNLWSLRLFSHRTLWLRSTYLASGFDAPNLIVGYHIFPRFVLAILEKAIMRLMYWIYKFVCTLNSRSMGLFDIAIPRGKCLLLMLLISGLKLSSC